jgi:hypothetical protein
LPRAVTVLCCRDRWAFARLRSRVVRPLSLGREAPPMVGRPHARPVSGAPTVTTGPSPSRAPSRGVARHLVKVLLCAGSPAPPGNKTAPRIRGGGSDVPGRLRVRTGSERHQDVLHRVCLLPASPPRRSDRHRSSRRRRAW